MSTAARIVLVALVGLAAGCSQAPVPRTYSTEELRADCMRTGGWWRGDLIAGLCDYQADGKI
jgi:hypothetical protein